MAVFRSTGDLRADKRHALAEAALKEGDAEAAADLFRQALELAEDFAPAHLGLGRALERLGERQAAAAAYARALALEPDDALGAAARLARLGALPEAEAIRPGYVAALFDDYADRFDRHLTEALAYRGPQIVLEALGRVCAAAGRPLSFAAALDLGCGAGLMARALAGCAEAIEGVDLSPRMAAKARATGLYREVRVADAADALRDGRRWPLLVAADVLVYVGNLGPLFAAAAAALADDGLFAFTVQTHEGAGWRLGADLRFSHSAAYLVEAAAAAGLPVRELAPCVTRRDAGRDVPGLVCVLGPAHGR